MEDFRVNAKTGLAEPLPDAPFTSPGSTRMFAVRWLALCGCLLLVVPASAQILDKQKLLISETFWDNRDWDWYQEHIPFFECPDREINTTYYYRWELLTKHLTYGSANTGYTFTEFIDRPFWSGAYGAISCPAGHQLYEARWLRQPRVAQDDSRYWFRTPGAQPRNYSTWLADSIWAVHEVQDDEVFAKDLLAELVQNYEAWEARQYVRDVGLFWQTGHDDGMEFNINSRQSQDLVRGAPAYRPSFNSYMWADAQAIARIADLAGETDLAGKYRRKAADLKKEFQTRLWDDKRQFFFPLSMRDEERDGQTVQALTLTYQTGKYAGSPHGRELIGYVPWQFKLPDPGRGYEQAWKFLMDPNYFHAAYGPTTVERQDPQFVLQKTCCWWSGQSWPYATTQTLKALANLLQDYDQGVITNRDYQQLLKIYTLSHRKDGKPYLAEALHPETGSFEGHDAYNHSEHYFHSGYCDLIITGLAGLKPRADDVIEIEPLASDEWEYFALDDLIYHGRRLSILWDKHGQRYGRGAGLSLVVDGEVIANAKELGGLSAKLPPRSAPAAHQPKTTLVNYAVNNEGHYYPRVRVSHTGENSAPAKLIDGNYWYHVHPPNRWTAAGSPNAKDWVELDLGLPRQLHTLKLYFLDDGAGIAPPTAYEIEYWNDEQWRTLSEQVRTPETPAGRRANIVRFPPTEVGKVRVILHHRGSEKSGLSEFESWGDAMLPVEPPSPPQGNLAYNPGNKPFPKASASHTSRFDRLETVNDGRVVYLPTPANRWTSYESTNESDWLQITFESRQQVGRAELHIYDDRGGVQTPTTYAVEYLDDEDNWREVDEVERSPGKPASGTVNTVRFKPVNTKAVRVVFTHRGNSRSGLTEIELWKN